MLTITLLGTAATMPLPEHFFRSHCLFVPRRLFCILLASRA